MAMPRSHAFSLTRDLALYQSARARARTREIIKIISNQLDERRLADPGALAARHECPLTLRRSFCCAARIQR